MVSGGESITGLYFDGQRHFPDLSSVGCAESEFPIFDCAKRWLDIYFGGDEPDFTPPVSIAATPFQADVLGVLMDIRYGQTMTYGGIAGLLAEKSGRSRISAQAVGGAVGRNPISIIIPCHRVVGADGSLTGYAGGIERKAYLLALERKEISR